MGKVLLIHPPNPAIREDSKIDSIEFSCPPLGLAYLAAELEANGISVSICDMLAERLTTKDIPIVLGYNEPAIIGISATTTTFPQAIEVAQSIKQHDKRITVVMGGPHPTFLPEQAILSGYVDYVLRGEAENTFTMLVSYILSNNQNNSSIPGLSFIKGREIIHRGAAPKPLIERIPLPARHLLRMEGYKQRGAIIASRGCPAGCLFCSCSAFSGRTYRARRPASIISEMKTIANNYQINDFEFHDDSFTIFPRRVRELCTLIQKCEFPMRWGCQSRANVRKELIKTMHDAGCMAIQFGVESGNDKILESINKGITIQDVENSVKYAIDIGIPFITCTFIIGLPSDTQRTVEDTITFAKYLKSYGARVTFGLFTPLPGTDPFISPEKYGIYILHKDWKQYDLSHAVIRTKHLSEDDLIKFYFEALAQNLTADGYMDSF